MKRRIFKLVLWLVLGATVTTATAWALAVFVPMDEVYAYSLSRVEPLSDEPQWFIHNRSRPGRMIVYSTAKPSHEPKGGSDVAPYWSRAATAPTREDVDAPLNYVEHAFGWPMLSHLESSTLWVGGGRRYAGWTITVPWPFRDREHRFRVLPLAPIWPGFAINTIFYAAILWVPFAPFTARRMIRRKRGRCPQCAYDLRGNLSSGCPECGWRREVPS